MNKQYAIEILEMVERHTLEKTSSLAKEAFNYLMRLKKLGNSNRDRILKILNK